ncbi:MAG: phosphate acyltransferase PlsX [Peptoniphilaceae bacterium]|nr:phosphate acyltransferase PlsX [Peptoniphilaceae bacterium]MDD7382838.1 phosphate acyltransferase PlsX [Peptoniphilaceae bacterium]MDY3738203.1 phosphate acyltransferase PlsX [Peptoniphilaceae bacterium]
MKIVVDTNGSDFGVESVINGAIKAYEKEKYFISFVGEKDKIEKIIDFRLPKYDYEIINSTEIINNNDEPVRAIRKKKNSSMVVAFNTLNLEGYDGLISQGSTGAILACSMFITGRLNGVKRASIVANVPTRERKTIIIDPGANIDTKPEMLMDFARMGSIYCKTVFNVKNPRIGLLNIGIEEHKGNQLARDTFAMLTKSNLNFIGNIEARDILTDKVEVIVTDGFSGNIAIKSIEGTAILLLSEIKKSILSSKISKIGAFLIKDKLKELLSIYNLDKANAAPVLGIKKPVFKCHGSSDSEGFAYAVGNLLDYIKKDVTKKLEGEFE